MGAVTTKADYARSKGWNKSTATRFAQVGRIVLTADGLVDVDASDAMLQATADPHKAGVAQRHAHERAAAGGKGQTFPGTLPGTAMDTYTLLHQSRAMAEAERATLLRMEREEKEGKLADTDAVRKQAFDAARAARNAIFNIRHRLDPLLAAEQDPAKRDALWEQELRSVCEQLAKSCGG